MSNSYLDMLNNPTINPPQKEQDKNLEKEQKLKPASFPPAQQAQDLLTAASRDVFLVSESDEPFEFINTLTDRDTLPTNLKELEELGLLNGGEEDRLRIKSVPEFLRQDEYKEIVKALEKLGELTEQGGKVYLVGDISITVLILILIRYEDKSAIVGLKSLLVQS
ncbi:hypothetical protein G6F56_008080 [Rhizopus delemar]|nr:hypothetical protein G6F56_008080 [Rhizopus delemar]